MAPKPPVSRIVPVGKPCKVLLTPADARIRRARRVYAVYTRRPEEVSFRVNEPPPSVNLLDTEESCRLSLRTFGPASIFVYIDKRTLNGGKPSLLFVPKAQKIRVGMHLPRPFIVHELPVAIDKWEKTVSAEYLSTPRFPFQLHGEDVELIRRLPLVSVEVETRDTLQSVAVRLFALRHWAAAHPHELKRPVENPRLWVEVALYRPSLSRRHCYATARRKPLK